MQGQYIVTGVMLGIVIGVFAPFFYPDIFSSALVMIENLNVLSGNNLSPEVIRILSSIGVYGILPLLGSGLGAFLGFLFYKFTQFR